MCEHYMKACKCKQDILKYVPCMFVIQCHLIGGHGICAEYSVEYIAVKKQKQKSIKLGCSSVWFGRLHIYYGDKKV